MADDRPVLPASIEATPRQAHDTADLGGLFPPGTHVYLTDVGTDSTEVFVAAARRLHDLGYNAVPHIPARRLASLDALADRLARLTGEAGVDNVLVIAGEAESQQGPFASSMDLLRTGLFDFYGIKAIGVAGHPEGSRDMAPDTVIEVLQAKNAFAEETDAAMRIVTQFGFDPQALVRWADGLAAFGNRLPVHIGVAGPAKITTLLKYASICGVGPSLKFLKKRTSALTALATSHSPEAVGA